MPDQQKVIEVLDALEHADWQNVGEVQHLVHPSDTRLLMLLVDECTRQLEGIRRPIRRTRLEKIRKRLLTTARLNEVLPIKAARTPPPQTWPPWGTTVVSLARPYKRRRKRKAVAGSTAPGYEEYHRRILAWLDEKSLSQHTLALALAVDPSYLSRAIRGQRPSRSLQLRIEEITGIPAPTARRKGKGGDEEEKEGPEGGSLI